MSRFKVGIIGCGRPHRDEAATGSGMAHLHAAGYEACPDTEIVAVADIKRENGDAFAEEHQVPRVYEDYNDMLKREDLDIVSVCLWIALHAPAVNDIAGSGVRAIHCEKPMAPTFGEARSMVEVCSTRGVQLTFNHQRRFGGTYREARTLAQSGAIGDMIRLEGYCPDIIDWGTHWVDMMFFYNDEAPADWVMGQIDAREEKSIFGLPLERQAIGSIRWKNGVQGLLETGTSGRRCLNRILGSEGVIEIGVTDGPALRYLGPGTNGWIIPEIDSGLHGSELVTDGILDLVDALGAGREPELDAKKALQATEVIFAIYESSRRRARIDLPLTIDDSPFLDMLERGEIGPGRTD